MEKTFIKYKRKLNKISTGILSISALALILFFLKYKHSIQEEKKFFIQTNKEKTEGALRSLISARSQIHQSLRLIAHLPGIKSLRNYENLAGSVTHKTIQEIYNNLSLNIDVSELYIVDKSLNPDAAAKPLPTTKPQIFAFDQLITEKSSESDRSKEEDDEEEIFEYRLMRTQLDFFRTHYPTENNVKTPNYPLLAGPEVRTCDHRYYTKQKHDESKRLGVVISVPFYSNDGSLKGMISAVILSTSVGKILPNTDYTLFSRRHGIAINSAGSQATASIFAFSDNESARNRIYFESLPVDMNEVNGDWRLLATQPDSQFWSQSSVRYTQIVFLMEVFIIFVLAATILYLFAFIKRRARFFLDQSIQLEKEVTRRTEEISDMQKKMYAAARLSSLGEVSAGISHEINNPLFIIKSLAMLLKKLSTEKSQSTDKYVEIADKMNTVVDRISKIISDLKKLSRDDQDEKIETIKLSTLIEDVLSVCRNQFTHDNVELSLKVLSDPTLECRPAQVSQAFLNLLNNSFLAVRKLPEKWIQVELSETQNDVVVRITDSGNGIPKEHHEKIMQPFFSTRPVGEGAGFGLGLSITRRIVHSHFGTLDLDESSRNTRFIIHLPKVNPRSAAA